MAFQKICEGIYEIHMRKVGGFVGFLLGVVGTIFLREGGIPVRSLSCAGMAYCRR
jgi:hypothetical protein